MFCRSGRWPSCAPRTNRTLSGFALPRPSHDRAPGPKPVRSTLKQPSKSPARQIDDGKIKLPDRIIGNAVLDPQAAPEGVGIRADQRQPEACPGQFDFCQICVAATTIHGIRARCFQPHTHALSRFAHCAGGRVKKSDPNIPPGTLP